MSAGPRGGATPTVAVVGASGSIGGELVRLLATLSGSVPLRLRLGGRRAHALLATAEALRGTTAGRALDVETQVCDVWDDTSLATFCAGADVVVSVAGPTYRIGGRIALAAVAAGAGYVDVGGDDPLLEALARHASGHGSPVVASAGALPGASALLPRYLAALLPQGDALTAHVGGMEACSTTVAEDMLLSLSRGGPDGTPFGTPLAAWVAGEVRQRALEVAPAHHLPGARGPVVGQPFLSAETARLAAALGLRSASWWNLWTDGHAWSVLSTLPVLLQDPTTSTRDIVGHLCRAAELDVLGRRPWYLMRFRLAHTGSGQEVVAELRTDSSSLVTALVATTAVRTVLTTPGLGTGFAADLLDPAEVVVDLESHPRIDLQVTGTADALTRDPVTTSGVPHAAVEEGAL
ncbi:saccharopine dehydrogenase NADP-binding domain-containing protein [Isoptericola croceus]|uniref:saccharopine dehydrogenase NADP-binding domain-containing protein n=1 Tax=Isoptericola croceus TaxID=3031406 RepID=UPI0023F942C9|nr:saccharopine dehydrogenase NADP-binding domain-containing protein [Isoptericola croceus]